MYIKSNYDLYALLLLLHEHADSEDAAASITEALEHMGHRSPYHGGRRLLELLDYAARDADRDGDAQTAAGLRDAASYATGTQLAVDIAEK